MIDKTPSMILSSDNLTKNEYDDNNSSYKWSC